MTCRWSKYLSRRASLQPDWISPNAVIVSSADPPSTAPPPRERGRRVSEPIPARRNSITCAATRNSSEPRFRPIRGGNKGKKPRNKKFENNPWRLAPAVNSEPARAPSRQDAGDMLQDAATLAWPQRKSAIRGDNLGGGQDAAFCYSQRVARPNHRAPHMGNRGIVKPEAVLRLPEVSANHVFEIVDIDHHLRVEAIRIVHRDKPAR